MSERSYNWKAIDLFEFYNLVIAKAFLVYDLREDQSHKARRIEGTITLSTPPESYGADRNDIILAYGISTSEAQWEEKLKKIYSANKYVKIVYILQESLDSFATTYPSLIEMEDNYNDFMLVYPCHILPHVFLSGAICSSQRQVLKNLNIKYILNVTDECPNHFEKDQITYLRLSVVDDVNEDLLSVFSTAFEFLEKVRNSGNGNVLVHCAAGRSRSASIVISYLMKLNKWPLNKSLEYVQKMREIAEPNPGFKLQLRMYEQMLNNNI